MDSSATAPAARLRLPDEPDHFIEFEILDYTMTRPERTRRVPVYARPENLRHFVEEGWLLAEQALAPDDLAYLGGALDRALEAERLAPDPTAWGKSGLTVRWLHYKAPEFLELLQLKGTLSIARAVLGPQVQLGCFQGRVCDADKPGQEIPWHIHNRVVPKPLPSFFVYPHGVHCLFYFDDVDPSNGAITVLPRSHLWIHELYEGPDFSEKPGQIDLYPKAGDCLLIHANLWHKVKPSQPGGTRRRMITCGYVPSWVRLDAVVGEKPPKTPSLPNDPELRELFGEFSWR